MHDLFYASLKIMLQLQRYVDKTSERSKLICTCTTFSSHLSRVRDRTLEMWTPRLRWTPEHSIHITMPRLILAQSGPIKYKEYRLLLCWCKVTTYALDAGSSFMTITWYLLLTWMVTINTFLVSFSLSYSFRCIRDIFFFIFRFNIGAIGKRSG